MGTGRAVTKYYRHRVRTEDEKGLGIALFTFLGCVVLSLVVK